jgi:hypothetical protein
MAQAASTGPLISMGGFAGAPNGGPPAEYSVEIGPSIFWQGSALLSMAGGGSKDKKGMGGFPALFMSDSILALNQVIQPAGAALTTPAPAVSGVSLPLATAYAPGVAPGTPIPSGALGVGIETGFAIGGTVAGSGVITVAANDKWRFSLNQFLSIAGAGVNGAMLFTKVTAIGGPGVNNITVSPPAVVAQAAAQIGTYYGDPTAYGFSLPVAYSSFMNGGAGRFILPDSGCARGVAVVSLAASPAGNVLIQGLDIYMRPQSELIATPAGAATTYGRKTYKVLLAATPQFTSALNYTVVTSDLIGLPLSVLPNQPPPIITEGGVARPDLFQYADLTSPATQATGDPRGGVQLSAAGPNAGAPGTTPTGTDGFVIVMPLNPAQVLSASQFNPGPLFGVPPA